MEEKINKKENKALRAGAKSLAEAMKEHVSRSKKHQKHIQVIDRDGKKHIEMR